MNLFEALVLGIVQGLTEFIPVSSSGHLVLLQRLFGIYESSLSFTVFVHFGTLVAVFIVLWKDLIAILKRPFSKLTFLLFLGAAVTGTIGIAFSDYFRTVFTSGQWVGISFLLTGAILYWVGGFPNGKKQIPQMSYLDAVFVGLMQAISIFPAISRSGMTISGALIRGLDRTEAARFSFLLSIPVILGANLLEAKDLVGQSTFSNTELLPIIIGTIAAAISGYFAIHYMLRLLSRGSLKVFSFYVFALGFLVLVDQLFFQYFFPALF